MMWKLTLALTSVAFLVMVGALDSSCSDADPYDVSCRADADSGHGDLEDQPDDHALLQTKVSSHSAKEEDTEAKRTVSSKQHSRDPSEPEADPDDDKGSAEIQESAARKEAAAQQLKRYNELSEKQLAALVPKDLAPLGMEDLRKLNASVDEQAALVDEGANATASSTPLKVWDFGAFCGSSARIDVAAIQGTGLSVNGCYAFSCVPPFKMNGCGSYFYTDGITGNCKCCKADAKYYYSTATPPNYVYSCR